MQLTDLQQSELDGQAGEAVRLSLQILTEMGTVLGADRLIPVASAHIDGCLFHGESGVLFAERLAESGGQVRIPATLNVGALDLLNPGNVLLEEPSRSLAQRLMDAYLKMGCQPTWTCAPYQAGHRPAAGTDVAWAESNAVVFANSVLGARTNRYGDFLDICSALTGYAPRSGLHLIANRVPSVIVRTDRISMALKRKSAFFPVLGAWLGRNVGSQVAAIAGLPPETTEDSLKALGASAASSGAVALFHAIGITPEARTEDQISAWPAALEELELTPEDVANTRRSLSSRTGLAPDVIALGSPHYSFDEVLRFEELRAGRPLRLPVYICTGRHTLEKIRSQGMAGTLKPAGIRIIADTCVVVTPIFQPGCRVVMTDSGKFAHYTPGNTGREVLFGSVEECVESAVSGQAVELPEVWR